MLSFHRFVWLPVAVLFFTACVVPPPKAAAPKTASDPAAMIEPFHVATNKHDIDTTLAFFDDNSTVELPNQPPPNIYKGKAEIRKWLEGDAAQNIHIAFENVQAKGDQITWLAKVDVDALRPLGITLIGNVETKVQQGKFLLFRFVLTDETVAKLRALPTTAPAK